MDYVGYWHSPDYPDRELTVLNGDGSTVHFSLRYADWEGLSNVAAELQGQEATFAMALEGTVVKGRLTFGENSISVRITYSAHPQIHPEVMAFTEQSFTSGEYTQEDSTQEEPTQSTNDCPYLFVVEKEGHGIYTDPTYDTAYVRDMPLGKYTIVDERYDAYGNLWGKLKSGEGWICLTEITEPPGTTGYMLPLSSVRLLTEADVRHLSERELRIAVNEIFARNGRRFQDRELQAYFDGQAWYRGTIQPDDFDSAVLSHIERENAEFLRWYMEYGGDEQDIFCVSCGRECDSRDAVNGLCESCAAGECQWCGGPMSENHNCDDYPNVVCPNCGWGMYTTGVGVFGVVCPECNTWVVKPSSTYAMWKAAYIQYLVRYEETLTQCRFRLVYLDGDQIPELVIQGPDEAAGTWVCAYRDGWVVEMRGTSYIPGTGLLYHCDGRMGWYSSEICRLDAHGFTELFYGWQEDVFENYINASGQNDFRMYSEFYVREGRNETQVSEEAFLDMQREIFDFNAAEDLADAYGEGMWPRGDISQIILDW